jgi:bacterioferritin-associated ferredoxin
VSRQELDQVLQEGLASSVSDVKAAIEHGRACALVTKAAEQLLASLLQRHECNKELEAAVHNKREDRLIAAISQAKSLCATCMYSVSTFLLL